MRNRTTLQIAVAFQVAICVSGCSSTSGVFSRTQDVAVAPRMVKVKRLLTNTAIVELDEQTGSLGAAFAKGYRNKAQKVVQEQIRTEFEEIDPNDDINPNDLREDLVVLQKGQVLFYFPKLMLASDTVSQVRVSEQDRILSTSYRFSPFQKAKISATPLARNRSVRITGPTLEFNRQVSLNTVKTLEGTMQVEYLDGIRTALNSLVRDKTIGGDYMDAIVVSRIISGRIHVLVLPTMSHELARGGSRLDMDELFQSKLFSDDWEVEVFDGDNIQIVNLEAYLSQLGLR